MVELKKHIAACVVCEGQFSHKPRPVVSFTEKSKILIIGQAPGSIVHESGIPWDDKSGENLRAWMGIDDDTFYNPDVVGVVPMGFCYPGKGKSGDLPPRKECAPLWHNSILSSIKEVQLTLLIGKYAQDYYLGKRAKKNLTETVRSFEHYLPKFIVLPHPSPRNNIWMKKNPWFKSDVIPYLQNRIKAIT